MDSFVDTGQFCTEVIQCCTCPIFFQRFCLAACLHSRILSAVLPFNEFNDYCFTVVWQAHTAPVQQLAHTYCGVVLKSSLIISVQCVSPAFVKACLIQTCLSYQKGKNPTNSLELSMRTINNVKKNKKKNSTESGKPYCYGINEEVRYGASLEMSSVFVPGWMHAPNRNVRRWAMAGSTRDVQAPGCPPLGTSTGPDRTKATPLQACGWLRSVHFSLVAFLYNEIISWKFESFVRKNLKSQWKISSGIKKSSSGTSCMTTWKTYINHLIVVVFLIISSHF